MKIYQFPLPTHLTDDTTGDLRKFNSYVQCLITKYRSDQDRIHTRVSTWLYFITHPELDVCFSIVVLII